MKSANWAAVAEPQTACDRSGGDAVTPTVFGNLLAGVLPAAPKVDQPWAVAVSGGADSMALLRLLVEHLGPRRGNVTVLTVDHGLRAAAGDEARQVGIWCRQLDIDHHILRIDGAAPTTGIQAWARTQRYQVMLQFCRDNKIQQLFLGHHRDDQLETLVHRLRRESGPEGLAAMAAAHPRRGVHLIRPLLTVRHLDLIATCRRFGQQWLDDPSNHDRRFQRVRDRLLLAALPGGEADRSALWRFADAMARTRQVMDRQLQDFFTAHGQLHQGAWASVQIAALRQLPPAASGFFLSRLLRALGGAEYPPRTTRLNRLIEQINSSDLPYFTATLSGCVLFVKNDWIVICREWQHAATMHYPDDGRWHRWDNRFEIRVSKGFGSIMCGSLGEIGWGDLRRERQLHELVTALTPLPRQARSAFPIIRKLDDGRVVNHLRGYDGSRSNGGDDRLNIVFRPNGRLLGPDEWIDV